MVLVVFPQQYTTEHMPDILDDTVTFLAKRDGIDKVGRKDTLRE